MSKKEEPTKLEVVEPVAKKDEGAAPLNTHVMTFEYKDGNLSFGWPKTVHPQMFRQWLMLALTELNDAVLFEKVLSALTAGKPKAGGLILPK